MGILCEDKTSLDCRFLSPDAEMSGSDGYRIVLVPKKCVDFQPEEATERICYVVSETVDFRTVAQRAIRSDDVVLEIGSSYGVCTQILARAALRVIALDNSEEALVAARERCLPRAGESNVVFHVCDALMGMERVSELGAEATAAFVDVGGDRLCEDVLWLLSSIQRVLRPRLLCVKSRSVWKWAEARIRLKDDTEVPILPASATVQAHTMFPSSREAGAFDSCRHLLQRSGAKRRHPLDYPQRRVPNDIRDPPLHICRYHNFLDRGCLKGEDCNHDHEHCYWCLEVGHQALICPLASACIPEAT